MRIYASLRRGHCASCEMKLTGSPVYFMDETYCCTGCANSGPCVCTYELDLADDGVNGLGVPFAVDVEPAGSPVAERMEFEGVPNRR